MDFVDTPLFQVVVVTSLATAFFFGAYSLPQKASAAILIILIPFQPITTQFASANVVLTWVVFIALLMRRDEVRLPMLPQICFVLLAYLISMNAQDTSTYLQHGLYVFNLATAFLVLWIAYDLTLRFRDPQGVAWIFVIMNVLVVPYCFVQLAVGYGEPYAFLGIQELSMMPLDDDYRLTGPFGGAGTIAEYFVVIVYLQIYLILLTTNTMHRRFLIVLLMLNLFLLVTTGNRGGFLTLVGAAGLYLWLFRKILGPKLTVGLALGGSGLLAASAAIAVNFTDFDVLFDRLTETEFVGGVPDTRRGVWPQAWEEIKTHPILGHGPRLRFVGEDDGLRYEGHKFIDYPHNQFLYMLFTVGIVGTIAFLTFLVTPLVRCWKASKLANIDVTTLTFAKTGVIIMIVLFIDQIKLEFTRYSLIDYWHFVFAIFGVLIAVCDRAKSSQNSYGNVTPAD